MSYKAQRESRKQHLYTIGLNPDDLEQWQYKYQALKGNAKLRDLLCLLTFEQYVNLASESGVISPSQMGKKPHLYQMGRIGDIGNYEFGNCRFITMSQNAKERVDNGGTVEYASNLIGNRIMVGRTQSEATKRKMSETRKGVLKSEDHKSKIGDANRGKTHSEDRRKKNSESQMGKKASEETKAKMRASRAAYELKKKLSKEVTE